MAGKFKVGDRLLISPRKFERQRVDFNPVFFQAAAELFTEMGDPLLASSSHLFLPDTFDVFRVVAHLEPREITARLHPPGVGRGLELPPGCRRLAAAIR